MVGRTVVMLAVASVVWAQAVEVRPLRVSEVGAKGEGDGRPRWLGETVRVRGVVETELIAAVDGVYTGLLDPETRAHGVLVVFSGDNQEATPETVSAGMVVEAEGVVGLHAGQVVLKPVEWKVVGQETAPGAVGVADSEGLGSEKVGRSVTVVGEVMGYEETAQGSVLRLKNAVLLWPHVGKRGERQLAMFRKGDRVKATGLLRQYAMRAGQQGNFQVLLGGPEDVEWLMAGEGTPGWLLPGAVAGILLAMVFAWQQQQRARRDQREGKQLLEASEELYGLPTVREAAELLRSRLMELTGAAGVSVYHYDANKKLLERIPDQSGGSGHGFHVEEGETPLERALGLAVRNGAALRFRQTRGVAVLGEGGKNEALVVLPMGKAGAVRGAVALTGEAGKELAREGLMASLQHLANDAGQHMAEIEEAAVREQGHRSEKLAVANQLIHGVISELNGPLEKLRDLAAALPTKEAEGIQGQVGEVSEIVKRIVAVARAEQFDARPVDLRQLFQRLLEGQEEGVEEETNLGPEPLYVLGSSDQLQRVFENLLKHARAAAGHSVERSLEVGLNRLGRSAMIEIGFSGPFGEGEGPDFHSGALGMAITRGLLQSYGGELRFATARPGRYRYDIELPSLGVSGSEEGGGLAGLNAQKGTLTALLVEPELAVQRRLLGLFGEGNHRLVPVGGMEEAVDLCEKMRFDVLFCSARPEGGTWAELFQRTHHRVPYFVLLEEGEETEAAELLEGTTAMRLRKPVGEEELATLLEKISERR